MRQRVNYSCETCNYTTTKKSSFIDHQNRKRPCKNTNNGNVTVSTNNTNLESTSCACIDPVVGVSSVCNADVMHPTGEQQETPTTEQLVCKDCKMSFDQNLKLRIHAVRCKGVHPLECPGCHFRFGSRQSKHTHIKKNSCKKINSEESNQLALVQQPAAGGALTPVSNAPTTVANIQGNNNTINTNTQNNTNNQTINIYGLGKEDVSYFTEGAQIHKLLSKVLDREKDGVCDLIYLKHFHPDHPENHNVKKMLKHDEVMHYFDGETWQRREARVVAQSVLKGVVANLTEMIDELRIYNKRVPKQKADKFMDGVGEALEVDFTGDAYDYEYTKTDEEKQRMSEQIVRYINNFIYEKTREMFPL